MKRVLFLLCTSLALSACGGESGATPGTSQQTAQPPQFVTVNARVVPIREADLSFQVDGQIAQWMADPGAAVAEGDPLGRLDTRLLEIRMRQAEAGLAQAQAALEQTMTGATEEEIAAAQASVAEAQGRLQATNGAVSQADLNSARARVTAAQEQLNRLLAGPRSDTLQAAVSRRDQAAAALKQAEVALATAQNDTSVNKTNAELALTDAANALAVAQSRYSEAYWENERAKLNDPVDQEDVTAFKSAEEQLAAAEHSVQRAQVALDQARQAELTGTAQAQQDVASAQAELAAAEQALQEVARGSERADIANAQAELAAAQAELSRLTGGTQAGNVAAAQGSVDAAQARLAELERGPRSSDIAVAEANVALAQTQLDEARLRLSLATLQAPFGGTIGQQLSEVGEQVAAGAPVVTLGDDSTWRIETDDLSELEVGRLAVGQQYRVTIDALDGQEFNATVVRIDPQPNIQRGEISYAVLLDLDAPRETPIRWGMSARVLLPATVTAQP